MNYNIDEFVKEVQAKFPEYKVNIDNVNDFYTMLKEKENNYPDGLKTIYKNGQFYQVKIKKDNDIIESPYSYIYNPKLPETIARANFKDFEKNTESRKKLYDYLMNFVKKYGKTKEKGLYIYGGFSIGKTYALGCFYRELLNNNINALMVYIPDLIVDLKTSIGTAKYGDIIDLLRNADVLLIDELGAENLTEWFRDEILAPTLNYRLVENKPIFITSNITPKDLLNHFKLNQTETEKLKANRIFSRIQSLVTSVSLDDSNKYKR
ncbi:MAG: cell division protein ZapE [Acholeplasmatales bacterium]|nr:cell division protein ZapE [Acholeplasmatales bacterium]